MRAAKFGLAAMAGAILASHGAVAQSSWYISGSAGALLVLDYSRSTTIFGTDGISGPGTNTSTYNPGETFNVALGYRLPLGLRVEGELGYEHFSIDTIDPLSTDGTFPNITGKRLSNPSGGDHERFTGTVNLFYDLPVTFAGITPYIGAGAGYYHATSSDAVFAIGDATFTQHGSSGNNAIVLAEIGASYSLTPQLSLTPAYRYEYFAGSSLHNANIVKLGLRYSF
jgi:outer membrane autotransporter protein